MLKKSQEYKDKYEIVLQKAIKETEKSVIGFFIKNYRFTYLIIFGIIIVGFFSMFTLPKEAEPEIRVPFAVVTTVYPGANPTDIEDLITNKIENEVKNLDNLKLYSSSSGQGFSSVFVEFNAEANLQDSFRKLREAADSAESDLPDGAETPTVTEINFNDFPIVTYSLVGADYSDVMLKEYADIIQDELENVVDVSEVKIIGGLTREFQVIVSQTKLANFNISLGQIINAINRTNFSLPAGDIEVDGYQYNVRVKGRFKNATELNDIVISTFENSPIFLRDIALVKDTFKEKKSESLIGFPGTKSNNTVSLQLFKKTGGNILDIVENSQSKIDELYEKNVIPDTIKIQKTNDNSVFIKDDLKTLGKSGLQTIILINIILMIVLSFRGAMITALSVPIAFLMAFIFLKAEGMTLNSMVLFSLVLSLGLMVDNSIVIIEGINEYITHHKKTVYEAALLSVWNFKWAITAGTMTTVGAFLPMLLVSGILGEYMSILPKTIAVTLLSSLFVAIIVIPTLATRFIKIKKNNGNTHRNKKRHEYLSKKISKMFDFYAEKMRTILPNKKKRLKYIGVFFVLFVISVTIPVSGIMKIEMFPKIDLDYFIINVETPIGSTLETTKPITMKIEKIVADIPELDNFVINIGSSASLDPGSNGSSGEHLASITVNLKDKDERERTSYEVAESIRTLLKNVQGGVATVEELAAGPPTGAPIEIRIFGDTARGLALVTKEIKDFLKTVDGVINIKDNIEDSAGEFTFSIDKQKANFYGLDMFTIASTLRNAIYGSNASEINIDGEDIDVIVKYDSNAFNTVNDLENILIFTPNGQNISLKQVAKQEFNPALLSIKHRDGKKYASISADIENDVKLQDVLKEFDEKKNSMTLPDNFNIKVGGEVEDIEKSFNELFRSMGLAIILIAFILVLQFNSFRQPFVIILALPLSIIGVIFGLNAIFQPFSFMAFIGIVSLSGIVINDSIVLIDRINKNQKNGIEFFESIVEAGVARMQPIFLTSVTTIAGVFPLIYASEMWQGFSYTLIFGLTFSTVLTLVVIPIIYASFCFKEKCK